jgi:hypothetical protein
MFLHSPKSNALLVEKGARFFSCRKQDYRRYTIPTDVRGKVFPTDLCGKVFPRDLGGKSSPTGDLGKIRTLVAVAFSSCLTFLFLFCFSELETKDYLRPVSTFLTSLMSFGY